MTTTVSLERKLVFVHIAKNGGISISRSLDRDIPLHPLNRKPVRSLFQAVRDTGIIDPFYYTKNIMLPEHATLREVETSVGRQISDFFVFGAVRNPWDREVSEYLYMTQQMKSRFLRRDFWRWRNKSFKQVLKMKLMDAEAGQFLQQIDHFRRADGTILLSDFCRFERLGADYERIAKKQDLTVKTLPHLNRGESKKSAIYYDDESREIVRQLYRDDISYFDYKNEEV